MISTRDKILSKIAFARSNRENIPQLLTHDASIYKAISGSLEDCFKIELETVAGECTICDTEAEIIAALKKLSLPSIFCKEKALQSLFATNKIPYKSAESDLLAMEYSISTCESLIARTGTVVISSNTDTGRRPISYAPNHIVIARKQQLVSFPNDAITCINEKYANGLPSMISFISGPSRTADIEKTLVLGAHGPKSLHVFIY